MPKFKTKRLILREFKKTDWEAVQSYASIPEVVEFMPFGPNTPKDTKKFIASAIKESKKKQRTVFEFAITLKENKALIGSCRITIAKMKTRKAYIGYILHPDYWNKGYATEAAQELLKFGFKKLKMHRIFAQCRPENEASAKVMKKIGMQYEGHLRKHTFIKGKWIDSLIFAILEDEFNQ